MIVFILVLSALSYFAFYTALIEADGAFIVRVSPAAAGNKLVFVIISGIDISCLVTRHCLFLSSQEPM